MDLPRFRLKGMRKLEYKTVAERAEARFVERKSEFIGYIAPAESEEEAAAFINEIRALHRKASHNCYAYTVRENSACGHSDDGEPQGTAGMPIFEVLRREGITDTVCVVTRYFGGILLGAGGLVRAYTNAAKLAVDAAAVKIMVMACKVKLRFDYTFYGRLPNVFSEFGVKVLNEDFGESVEIFVYIKEELFDVFQKRLLDTCGGKIVVELQQKEWADFA